MPEAYAKRRRKRGNLSTAGGGFSLIECAIAIACAATLLLAAVPAVEHIHQAWALWTGTRVIETTLQWGRFHSISANDSLMLEVNAEGTVAAWRDPEAGSVYGEGVRYMPRGVRIASAPSKPQPLFPHDRHR